MTQTKTKKHRDIEKKYGCRKDSLKEAISWLVKNKHNLDEAVKGCEDYCRHYGNNFEVAFNLYVSCLKNPKPKEV